MVICQEKIVPLTLVECYPIGVMLMTDNDDLDEITNKQIAEFLTAED